MYNSGVTMPPFSNSGSEYQSELHHYTPQDDMCPEQCQGSYMLGYCASCKDPTRHSGHCPIECHSCGECQDNDGNYLFVPEQLATLVPPNYGSDSDAVV
jgi:hypothetical protein